MTAIAVGLVVGLILGVWLVIKLLPRWPGDES